MRGHLKTIPDWRTTLTYLSSWGVGASYVYVWSQTNEPFHILPALYVLAFFVAPVLSGLRSLAARIVARAFWLQSSVLYLLVSGFALYDFWDELDFAALRLTDLGSEVVLGFVIWAGPIVALFAAGVRGLDLEAGSFAPVAFRKTMLASLIFGAADLFALTIYSAFTLSAGPVDALGDGLLLAGCAAVMGLALFGLYRTRLWGLALCVAANLLVAGLAIGGALPLPDILAAGLVATAVLQLLIPLPMIRRIVTGLRRKGLPNSP